MKTSSWTCVLFYILFLLSCTASEALAGAQTRIPIHWISPESGTIYAHGDHIIAAWSSPSSRQIQSWALRLCLVVNDRDGSTCGEMVWADVERSGGRYEVSLPAPKAQFTSTKAFLKLEDDAGSTSDSPAFILDQSPVDQQSEDGNLSHSKGDERNNNIVVQAVFTTTTTIHIASPTSNAHFASANTHAAAVASPSSSQNSTLASSQTNLADRPSAIGPALAISLPLGLVGIALMVAACVCTRYGGGTKRKGKSMKGEGAKDANAMRGGGRAGLPGRGKSFRVGSDPELGEHVESEGAQKRSKHREIEKAAPSRSPRSLLFPSSASSNPSSRQRTPQTSLTPSTQPNYLQPLRTHPTRVDIPRHEPIYDTHPLTPSSRTHRTVRRELIAGGFSPGILFEEVGPDNEYRWTTPKVTLSEDNVERTPPPRPPTPYALENPTVYRPQSATPNRSVSERLGSAHLSDDSMTGRTSDKDTASDSSVEAQSATTARTMTTNGRLTAAVTDTVLSRYLMPSPLMSQSSAYSTATRASFANNSPSSSAAKAGTGARDKSGSEADFESGEDTDTDTLTARNIGQQSIWPELRRTLTETEASVLDEEDQVVISRAMFESGGSTPSTPPTPR